MDPLAFLPVPPSATIATVTNPGWSAARSVGYRPAVTATRPEPVTDAPKRGVIAGVIAFAAHLVVVLVALVAARVVGPGEGFQDLATALMVIFGGEIVVTLACVVISAVQYRRGLRHTPVGLMAGWLVGILAVMALLFV